MSTPPRSARTPRPSRMVPPQPATIASGSPAPRTHSCESPSRTASGTAVPPLAGEGERRVARPGRVERAVDEAAVPAHDARAGDRREADRPPLARGEHHLRARGDREAPPPRRGAVEAQRAVDLEEVEV